MVRSATLDPAPRPRRAVALAAKVCEFVNCVVLRYATRTLARAGLLIAAVVFLAAACGQGEPDRDPIRLQANAVGGGQVFYEDLASQDTVLWFWAPW